MTTQFQQEKTSAALAQQLSDDSFAQWQAQSAERFQQAPWPSRKTEHWKYTPLKSLLDVRWQAATAPAKTDGVVFENFNEVRITIANGSISNDFNLPTGVQLLRVSELSNELRSEYVAAVVAQQTDFLFDALNASALDEGYWLKIEAGAIIEQPLHINYVSSGNNIMINTQLLVDIAPNAAATLVESFSHLEGDVFVNPNTSLRVSENAQLTHYHLLLDEGEVRHVGKVAAVLQRSARLHSFHMAVGGLLKRKDIVVRHCGEGAELVLNGVYLPRGKEHIDYHTVLEHEVPHCTSEEVFRGIIGDSATAVFNGRIHIHKHAQKSLAELNNKNLLLSPTATINTKPELEIYADDVKCAHGATIAQLDKKQLFYFQARGISRAEAEVMLSFGFINELLEALPDEPVKQLLKPMLLRLFSGSSADLTRHVL